MVNLEMTFVEFMCAIGSINSHCFPMVGDGKNQPNSRGLYIPIITIPY